MLATNNEARVLEFETRSELPARSHPASARHVIHPGKVKCGRNGSRTPSLFDSLNRLTVSADPYPSLRPNFLFAGDHRAK